jgi:hypothetical protein
VPAFTGGDKLRAQLEKLARRVRKKAVLEVGYPAGARYPNGTSLAMVAAVQDFGAPSRGIPPRPFFRNAVKAGEEHWGSDLGKMLKATGYDAEVALGQLGEQIKGEIQQSIIDTNSPPLKPATIKRKGSAKPLVDTGFMLRNVQSTVKTE